MRTPTAPVWSVWCHHPHTSNKQSISCASLCLCLRLCLCLSLYLFLFMPAGRGNKESFARTRFKEHMGFDFCRVVQRRFWECMNCWSVDSTRPLVERNDLQRKWYPTCLFRISGLGHKLLQGGNKSLSSLSGHQCHGFNLCLYPPLPGREGARRKNAERARPHQSKHKALSFFSVASLFAGKYNAFGRIQWDFESRLRWLAL